MKELFKQLKFRFQKQVTPEFWSMVRYYLPLVPVYLYYAYKNRSLTYFTNVNPAIPLGGLFGESKIEILNLFPSSAIPKTLYLEPKASFSDGLQWLNDSNITFPIVAKPNVGERGDGVLFIYNAEELRQFYLNLKTPYLLQEAITYANEYGIFVAKNPETGKVKVLSITGKKFLSVTGDGKQTVQELLGNTLRGWLQLPKIEQEQAQNLQVILPKGKIKTVGNIGNHCLGTTFLDSNDLITPQLEEYLTSLFQFAEGLYYGRLDIKANSITEMVEEGKFSILEMNGVSSEPGLAFDPSYSLLKSYRTVISHLKVQSEVSRLLALKGFKPASNAETLKLLGDYHNLHGKWWFTFLKKLLLPKKDQKAAALQQQYA